MYDWMTEALQGSSQVVTANRRLARALIDHHAKNQVEAGRMAWRSPRVLAWQDWLQERLDSAELVTSLPTRLDVHQSRILWERCLRREITDPLVNTAALVRQSLETWTRLNDYCVPLEQVVDSAQGRDHRIFARAATGYQSILGREGWVDDAQIAALAANLLRNGAATANGRVSFVGFDRLTPVASDIQQALQDAGSDITNIQLPPPTLTAQVLAFENADAELRAAGAWARQALLKEPAHDVAIVMSQLERNSERAARLVRETLVPGWQTEGRSHQAAVNVSYGNRLSNYPVIAVALLLLRWSHEDINSKDLSLLLRSCACGDGDMGGRSRLDIELRRLPIMNWSPGRFLKSFNRTASHVSGEGWLVTVERLQAFRQSATGRKSPSQWAVLIDSLLDNLNWPGSATLDNVEFQLVNRWRELLNDFARLELVAPSMSLGDTLSRLQTMAGETVFQPESEGSIVQLLGPLEAAGMQFNCLWVAGLSASNWPPPSRPSPLVSRQLQRDYEMPDADPADTLAYARRVVRRLSVSAQSTVFSYPIADGDVEQSPSGLIDHVAQPGSNPVEDPGWYARQLVESGSPQIVSDDPVPPVAENETIKGGATTIQRQLTDPITAFAFGRLGIRPVVPFVNGLPATLRGSLVHDALNELYRDLPSRQAIASWSDVDLEQRAPVILGKAFAKLEAHADTTLQELLELEKHRVALLLKQVIELDLGRAEFTIEGLEQSLQLEIDQVRLGLRVDRIDRVGGDEFVIIDYKTGQPRRFLNSGKEPDDLQLVTYACALTEPVAGLAYVNVDSRQVNMSGAGREFTPDLDWDDNLLRWRQDVVQAAQALQQGDVRINGALPVKTSRNVGLLSRIRELQHDG